MCHLMWTIIMSKVDEHMLEKSIDIYTVTQYIIYKDEWMQTTIRYFKVIKSLIVNYRLYIYICLYSWSYIYVVYYILHAYSGW